MRIFIRIIRISKKQTKNMIDNPACVSDCVSCKFKQLIIV